jgi:hypothetical protein
MSTHRNGTRVAASARGKRKPYPEGRTLARARLDLDGALVCRDESGHDCESQAGTAVGQT